MADPPIPSPHEFAPPDLDEDLADYVTREYFGNDSQGRSVCLRCGCFVAEGWAAEHFKHQHLHIGGF